MTAASLVAVARQETGLEDMGASGWEEGLERLVHALATEADLNAVGEGRSRPPRSATTSRAGSGSPSGTPGIPRSGGRPVPAPVVIIGQPRTGTTILFDLLAQDPRFRVPLTWEVAQPHPPPETATYATDPVSRTRPRDPAMTEALIPASRPSTRRVRSGPRNASPSRRGTSRASSLRPSSTCRVTPGGCCGTPTCPRRTGITVGSSNCCSGATPASGGC